MDGTHESGSFVLAVEGEPLPQHKAPRLMERKMPVKTSCQSRLDTPGSITALNTKLVVKVNKRQKEMLVNLRDGGWVEKSEETCTDRSCALRFDVVGTEKIARPLAEIT
jgi:hypothetical protein